MNSNQKSCLFKRGRTIHEKVIMVKKIFVLTILLSTTSIFVFLIKNNHQLSISGSAASKGITSSTSNSVQSTGSSKLTTTSTRASVTDGTLLAPDCQQNDSTNLTCCPPYTDSGEFSVNFAVSLEIEMETKYFEREAGGFWAPPHCSPLYTVAIIVPYRDRAEHLLIFLNNMHHFLRQQMLAYQIFIISQKGDKNFNRAALMNVGYFEAVAMHNFSCLIFHDIDLIPCRKDVLYSCRNMPMHLAAAQDRWKWKYPYGGYFGGVNSFVPSHIKLINGFPNDYWGWGGEDDDIAKRVRLAGLKIIFPSTDIYRYKAIPHKEHVHDQEAGNRMQLLGKTAKSWKINGLNSMQYLMVSKALRQLYCFLLVDLSPKTVLIPTSKGIRTSTPFGTYPTAIRTLANATLLKGH